MFLTVALHFMSLALISAALTMEDVHVLISLAEAAVVCWIGAFCVPRSKGSPTRRSLELIWRLTRSRVSSPSTMLRVGTVLGSSMLVDGCRAIAAWATGLNLGLVMDALLR